MDKKAWVHQLKKQVDKFGEKDAPWYVTWNDPDGKRRTKSCGAGKIGKSAANKLADKTHAELVTGTYQAKSKMTWKKFRDEYNTRVANRAGATTKQTAMQSLDAFERVANPKLLVSITASVIQKFVTDRLMEDGIRREKVSPATVNKDLRYLRVVLNLAEEWGFIVRAPKIRFLKQPQKLPTYVPPEHFAAIYVACETAKEPNNIPNVTAADWWRGLLTTAYMTGWRISQLLELKWSDVDLDGKTLTTRADAVGNKGKREDRIPLHSIVTAHIQKLQGSFDANVFPWHQNRRDLWPAFQQIQKSTTLSNGKPMPQAGKGGAWYGFHDFRRGFATMNAESMDLFELQALMQHKTLATTQAYVNMAKRLKKPVSDLYVPPSLRISETG